MACRTLREPGLVDAMHDLLRHGLGRSVEDGRLIHVIPKACNAHLRKVPETRAPPGASLCASKIRKDTGTRPYHARVNAAIRILYEVVTGNASVVGRIAVSRKVCDMQIRNRDHMKIFRGELCDHPGKVREAIAVHSKRTVLLLENQCPDRLHPRECDLPGAGQLFRSLAIAEYSYTWTVGSRDSR